ncbi:DNA-binding XRE family transcriptional regulator [Staphylococcus hominis]
MIELTNSKKLNEEILLSGNTKNSFASLIGVSPATLTVLFKTKKVSPKTAKLIVDNLNVDFEEIFKIVQKEA